MKKIWTAVDRLHVTHESKNRLFILFSVLAGLAAGIVLCAVTALIFSPGPATLVCFAGYPVLLSGFGSVIYLYNNEFDL